MPEDRLSFYNVDHQIELFSTKIAWEVAVTNGTALSEDVKVVNVDVKKIFDPSELLVAINHPDIWAGGAENSSSCQLLT